MNTVLSSCWGTIHSRFCVLLCIPALLSACSGCPPTEGNQAPTATDQQVSTSADSAVTIMLMADDPDAGDMLSYTITALPEDGLLANLDGVAIMEAPAELAGAGSSVVYTPDQGFIGEDSFSFTTSDGMATSNEAVVTISVEAIEDGPPFDEDVTLETLSIPAGQRRRVENNAVITVNGDATINGILSGEGGRVSLRVAGELTINGTIRAMDDTVEDLPSDTPLADQPVGIHLIVGDEEATIGDSALLESTGHIVVSDDETVLMMTPQDLFDEVEDTSGDDLPTLVPLPPDNDVFMDGNGDMISRRPPQGGMLPPVNIRGAWPPPGAPPVPGDAPVIIFRFLGSRPLNLDNWTVNGPPAPAGDDADQTNNPGDNASGQSGRNGMRLNIWNNGGPINIVNNVVLNLTNGGDGGSATSACASATGGDGGLSGNFRMTAAGGIDITNGTLTINPGRGGHGGNATVNSGPAGADGCDGADGADSTANGGSGGDNRKRIFARGNVQGLANVTIGALVAGNGGNATATACDGGNGTACCNGGAGGDADSRGGDGGDATLNLSGLPIGAGAVTGGNGGNATSTGGNGGDASDCKFADAGDGGAGGAAEAIAGAGGGASGGAASTGGNGGDATATGGNGGDGGDSGFGDPGDGGARGVPEATEGSGGAGDISGSDGQSNPTDGAMGSNGGALTVTLYCIPLPLFVQVEPGPIEPGPKSGLVQDVDNETQIGTIQIAFLEVPTANYQRGENPDHIGIGNSGALEVDVTTLQLDTDQAGVVGGLRIEPLNAIGISEINPLIVQAFDAEGQLMDEVTFAEVPNNQGSTDPAVLDATFNVEVSVGSFRIVAPNASFVTIVRVYLLDP